VAPDRSPGTVQTAKTIYWHRELPPLDAEVIGEYPLEALSKRISSALAHRDDLWALCYRDLMIQATRRLEQEIARLGGHCAHVVAESVDVRHDDVQGEAWLHGRFTYVLYRRRVSA
jgi:hypothetical protein